MLHIVTRSIAQLGLKPKLSLNPKDQRPMSRQRAVDLTHEEVQAATFKQNAQRAADVGSRKVKADEKKAKQAEKQKANAALKVASAAAAAAAAGTGLIPDVMTAMRKLQHKAGKQQLHLDWSLRCATCPITWQTYSKIKVNNQPVALNWFQCDKCKSSFCALCWSENKQKPCCKQP